MHERTHRLLCKSAFVWLCAFPTIATIGIVSVRATPWYKGWRCVQAEQELGKRFGLHFEIGELTVLSPDAIQLDNVQLTHPETQALVASIRMIQYSSRKNRVAIRLAQPSIESQHLPYLWQLLHDHFLCRPELTRVPVRLAADDATIASSSGGVTLTDIQAYMQPTMTSNELTSQFKIAGCEMPSPATVTVTRDRTTKSPETIWKLHTGGASLPCSVAADYLPWLRTLGTDAEFNGMISWHLGPGGWQVNLGGSSFSRVEVSRIFERLEYKLTGIADVWLWQGQIQQGRLTGVVGNISIHQGQIGSAFVYAASQTLGLQPLVRLDRPSMFFDLMRLNFSLDESGWRFVGACTDDSNDANGILAVSDTTPLAYLLTADPIATGTPKQLIAPNTMMSFGRKTSGLSNLLPAPDHRGRLQSLGPRTRVSMSDNRTYD